MRGRTAGRANERPRLILKIGTRWVLDTLPAALKWPALAAGIVFVFLVCGPLDPLRATDERVGPIVVIHASGRTTLYSPTDDTNAGRGEALVKAFATHRNGDEIRVGPGEYDVACGALLLKDARLTGAPGTIIRARANTATHPNGDAIIGSFSPAQKKQCEVRGIRFDCNLQNQDYPSAVIAAVSLLGGGSIEDCSAINWGSKGVENFVFIIGCQPGNGGLNAPSIRRCIVDTPAPIVNGRVVTAFDIWSNVGGSRVTRDWVRNAEIAYCVGARRHDRRRYRPAGSFPHDHARDVGEWQHPS